MPPVSASPRPSVRRRRFAAAAAFLLAPATLAAQQVKPGLDHEDTYRWKSIGGRTISADGAWLTYVLSPWDGDPTLVITRSDGSSERRFRGRSPSFTRDSRHLVFRVPPVKAVVDSLRLEGERGDALPGDSLAVVNLAEAFADGAADDGGVRRAGPISSFRVPQDGGAFVAYLLSENPEEEEAEEEGEEEEEAEEAEAEEEGEEEGAEEEEEERSAEYEKRHEKEDGTPLMLLNLDSGAEHSFADVASYTVADAGNGIAYVTSTEDEGGDGIYLVDPASGESVEVLAGEGHYEQLAFDESGEHLAFLSNVDEWEMDQPSFALYRSDGGAVEKVADHETAGVPADWWISENGSISFSEDGDRLFFGTAPRPEPEPDEDVLDADRVRLDIWNWRDPYLQPMQLVRANQERNRSYVAVAHEGRDGVVQLGTASIPEVSQTENGMSDYVLATSDIPHRQKVSWDGRYQDAYAVDVLTGERRMIVEAVRGFGGARLSPEGTYAYWWDETGRDWKAAPMDGSASARSLTGHLPVAFFNELDDHPQGPPPYGGAMWVEGDAAMLVSDRNDVWRVDPSGEDAALRLTDGRGADLRYRVQRVSGGGGGNFFGFGGGGGGEGLEEGDILFSVFDLGTKASGYARGRTDDAGVEELIMDDVRYAAPAKAEDAERYVWTRQTFVEFPDLWVGDTDFGNARKVSDANPQQAEYRWGSAELVHWMSSDRTPLDGILIKPDGFDPSQKYPLMVYFYERMSDGLHSYQQPLPNRASVRFSFYASRGYVVFVPDIPYEIGYPGESGLDAVVPGVLSLVEQGFIDPDRIGVQGHSWGGYQIAYMITKTNIFAAAEAGAPVSNMTSAYGGIRWQSGMSRMFQYERTQSRIGGTLWDERDRYVHNSPVFFADKIRTPLLMLHNDEDGAVPWYQGIEMFVAMRRLSLPVFMLNYNGEGHGLGRQANQEDWAIRMQQFFDYYLIDAPAPRWDGGGRAGGREGPRPRSRTHRQAGIRTGRRLRAERRSLTSRVVGRAAGSVLAALIVLANASPAWGAVTPSLRQEVAVDTLESGRVVVRNPAPARGEGPTEWRLVEELRLGQLDGTGPEVFGDLHDVAVDEKGHIYVVDVGSKEVRVFDREGRHLRNIARDGEGPDEFRYSGFSPEYRIIWQPPNRLWVGDRYQQLSFDSLGNELTRTGQPFGPGMPISSRALRGSLAAGRIVAADGAGFVYQVARVIDRTTSGNETVTHGRSWGVRLPVYPEHPNPVPPRDSLLLESRVSTSTAVPTTSSGSTITLGGIVKIPIPRRVWGFGRSGTAWLANRAAYRFHEVTFAGDTVRTVELGDPPPPPPDDSEESEFEPLMVNLDVSPEGWLWVLRFPDDPADSDETPTWDLFDNCGRYRGEVSAPARIATVRYGGEEVDPIDLGARGVVHGIARDALDVSYVLRLRLEGTDGARATRESCPF